MHNIYLVNINHREKCNNYLTVINWDFMDLTLNLKLDDCDQQ